MHSLLGSSLCFQQAAENSVSQSCAVMKFAGPSAHGVSDLILPFIVASYLHGVFDCLSFRASLRVVFVSLVSVFMFLLFLCSPFLPVHSLAFPFISVPSVPLLFHSFPPVASRARLFPEEEKRQAKTRQGKTRHFVAFLPFLPFFFYEGFENLSKMAPKSLQNESQMVRQVPSKIAPNTI